MKPGTLWIGVTLLAVGVCGIMDAAGVADSSQTIGQWWPLAVIAWAVSDMLVARRTTLGGVVWAGVGLALLADAQSWASDTLVWSSLAAFVGLAMLLSASARRRDGHDGDVARTVVGGGAR